MTCSLQLVASSLLLVSCDLLQEDHACIACEDVKPSVGALVLFVLFVMACVGLLTVVLWSRFGKTASSPLAIRVQIEVSAALLAAMLIGDS